MKANWKVGDKVKVLRQIEGHEFEIGSIVEVGIYIGGSYLCTDGDYSWFLSEEEAELIDDSHKLEQPNNHNTRSNIKPIDILLKHLDKGASERKKKLNRLVDYSLFIAAMEEYADLKTKETNQ